MAWGAPQPIDELNSAFLDTHSSMSDDKLIICFASDRPGGVGLLDIWCAKRTAADAPFDAPMNQTAINTPEWDSYPVLTADGGTLYYTARPQGDPDNIYRASWNGTAFVNPVAVTPLNSNSADRAAAALDTDVYFHSDRAGSDDIYSGTRVGDGPWQNIAPVAILNTEYGDGEPRRRGNRLVFCSTRPGAGTLYGSTLILSQGTWLAPELLDIEGVNDGCGPSILTDGSLLFHSERPGGKGGDDLYIAEPR